jgi:hypothetical protein
MKDWKIDPKKGAYIKIFDFLDYHMEEKSNFISRLLIFDSNSYRIDVSFVNKNCLVSFIPLQTMHKMAVDNIINSVDLIYQEIINGKED